MGLITSDRFAKNLGEKVDEQKVLANVYPDA